MDNLDVLETLVVVSSVLNSISVFSDFLYELKKDVKMCSMMSKSSKIRNGLYDSRCDHCIDRARIAMFGRI